MINIAVTIVLQLFIRQFYYIGIEFKRMQDGWVIGIRPAANLPKPI